MRVLGVDPGSIYMGIACVEAKGRRLTCIGQRLVQVKEKGKDSWEARLRNIYFSTKECIALWKPHIASVESVFMAKNASSALRLGQARGGVLTAIAASGVPIFEYSTRSIKQSVTSVGNADKQQVEKMVKLLLGSSLKEKKLRHDVYDALAASICHIQSFLGTRRTRFSNTRGENFL